MPIVKPIHAVVGEVVEIHWHRTDLPAEGETSILRERHTAPPVATWDARQAEPPLDPIEGQR